MKRRVLIQVGNVLMPIQDMTQQEALSQNKFNFYRGCVQIGSAKFDSLDDKYPECKCMAMVHYVIFSAMTGLIIDKRVSV